MTKKVRVRVRVVTSPRYRVIMSSRPHVVTTLAERWQLEDGRLNTQMRIRPTYHLGFDCRRH